MTSPRIEILAEGVTLYCGDCREILPTIRKVDAVVTDPPYGIGINKSNRLSVSRGHGGENWDDLPIDAGQVAQLLSAATWQIIWGGNYFDLPPTRCFLVWDKLNAGRDFADVEFAWTNIDAVARRFQFRPMNMDGGKEHPTQKPIDLMRWCIGQIPPPCCSDSRPVHGVGIDRSRRGQDGSAVHRHRTVGKVFRHRLPPHQRSTETTRHVHRKAEAHEARGA